MQCNVGASQIEFSGVRHDGHLFTNKSVAKIALEPPDSKNTVKSTFSTIRMTVFPTIRYLKQRPKKKIEKNYFLSL